MWSETALLRASDATELDQGGFSPVLDGDTIATRSPRARDAGGVYVRR